MGPDTTMNSNSEFSTLAIPKLRDDGSNWSVRVSPVALQLGSEMDPYRRDLTNILHSYLVSDGFGPMLGARA